MKKTIAILFAVGAIALTASAQTPNVYTALNGGTNNVASPATNTYSLTQAVNEFDNVGIQVSYTINNSDAGALTNRVRFDWYQSLDSTSYNNDAPAFSFTVTPTGSNVVFVTNWSIPSAAVIGNFKVATTNPVTTCYITNLTVKYNLKAPKKKSI